MHGRNRSEYKAHQRDPKTVAKLGAKAQQWHVVSAKLLQQRTDLRSTAATTSIKDNLEDLLVALTLTENLLTVNPDPLSLWNHRRELLQALPPNNASNDTDAQTSPQATWDLATELRVTQTALQNNPKAYGAWFHRKWVIQQHLVRTIDSTSQESSQSTSSSFPLLQQELALTALFLQRDERNFHCWNYRRFLVACQLELWCFSSDQAASSAATSLLLDGSWKLEDDPTPLLGAQIASLNSTNTTSSLSKHATMIYKLVQQELEFSDTKIQQNFSNFSAFHYRSKLLPLLPQLPANQDSYQHWTSLLAQEFEIIENAVFTEPDDQTAWWYQRFLLDFAADILENTPEPGVSVQDREQYKDRLEQHLDGLNELRGEVVVLEGGGGGKWVLLGIFQVMEHMNRSLSGGEGENDERMKNEKERRDILQQLCVIDPDRSGRYQHMLEAL